jgi:hypothetical protein
MEIFAERETRKRIPSRVALVWLCLPATLVFLLTFVAAQPEPLLATMLNLVVVDLQVRDAKTGKPITDLRGEDFEVDDNGEPAHLLHFRANEPDPIALWIVAGCSSGQDARKGLSDSERDALLDAGLDELTARETAGVAQLCGEKAEISLPLTLDRGRPSATLDNILRVNAGKRQAGTTLEVWRRTFQLLHTNGPVLDEVAPLPVIVFLRPAELSVRKSDAKALAQEILSHTRTIVYNVGNKDASEPETSSTMSLLPHLSRATGGQSFSAMTPPGETLRDLLVGLRSRYTLAWFPSRGPGWHEITVRLTKDAAERNPRAVVACRAGYSASRYPSHYTIIEKRQALRAHPGFERAESAAGAATDQPALALDAQAATYRNTSQAAHFKVSVAGDAFSWSANPDAADHAELALDVAFYAEDHKVLSSEVHEFSIVKNKDDGWMRVDLPVELSVSSRLPRGASYVRFRLRDEASGRAGAVDLPMKKVLEAPKAGIYGIA